MNYKYYAKNIQSIKSICFMKYNLIYILMIFTLINKEKFNTFLTQIQKN